MARIRKFKPSDGEAVLSLVSTVLREEFHRESSAFPMHDLKDVSAGYGGDRETFLVAVADGQVVGTCGVKQDDTETALLRRLFVSPDHRRKGIGGRLVDAAVEFARKTGYEQIVFRGTTSMSAARELCQGKGFSEREVISMGDFELFAYGLPLNA
jgi:GNAT superfamily N-acetyltransferase